VYIYKFGGLGVVEGFKERLKWLGLKKTIFNVLYKRIVVL